MEGRFSVHFRLRDFGFDLNVWSFRIFTRKIIKVIVLKVINYRKLAKFDELTLSCFQINLAWGNVGYLRFQLVCLELFVHPPQMCSVL